MNDKLNVMIIIKTLLCRCFSFIDVDFKVCLDANDGIKPCFHYKLVFGYKISYPQALLFLDFMHDMSSSQFSSVGDRVTIPLF